MGEWLIPQSKPMAKRSKRKKAVPAKAAPEVPGATPSPSISSLGTLVSSCWLPLLLAVVAFLVYWPSLKSDFVYDARVEIIDEGFITSLSNLPAVLSFKVLGMNLMLGDRPGQILYLMSIAAICGRAPFGYHLCSSLLHAANVALLYVLLLRLAKTEIAGATGNAAPRIKLAATAATLIFALHPLGTEVVAAINYSSDLLVTCFTLLALLAATAFRPENLRRAVITGGVAVLCAFAAVTCKESGLEVAALLICYWFLFRRREATAPWLCLVGAVTGVTFAFLAARFFFAPPPPNPNPLHYLGGSFFQVFWIQPRLWVFMMGKLVWPVPLSADYTLDDVSGLSLPVALTILVVVILLQGWLAMSSRLGALGIAFFWLGLVTVSNFIPLHRPLADRFYYLPLAGVSMQLLALLLMTLRLRKGFWVAVALCLVSLLPMTLLTVNREHVFSSDFTLWSDTVKASPLSSTAYCNLGFALGERGQLDEAIISLQKALELNPNYDVAHNDLGLSLLKKGRPDEATAHFLRALEINPNYASARCNLGSDFLRQGQVGQAIAEFQTALKLAPNYAEAHYNLGTALLREGQLDQAISEFQRTLEIDPRHAKAHNNLGNALNRAARTDEAFVQFQKAVESDPALAEAHYNLGNAFVKRGQLDGAITQFQAAVRLNPQDANAQNNLAVAKSMAAQASSSK